MSPVTAVIAIDLGGGAPCYTLTRTSPKSALQMQQLGFGLLVPVAFFGSSDYRHGTDQEQALKYVESRT